MLEASTVHRMKSDVGTHYSLQAVSTVHCTFCSWRDQQAQVHEYVLQYSRYLYRAGLSHSAFVVPSANRACVAE